MYYIKYGNMLIDYGDNLKCKFKTLFKQSKNKTDEDKTNI